MKFVSLALLIAITGCTAKKVSFDTLEDARKIARENAELNAQEFRQKNPEYASCGIGSAGDSTQSVECPQGDGWATLELKCNPPIKLKCSTVSNAIGCVNAEEFKGKPYANEDNHCNAVIPAMRKLEK